MTQVENPYLSPSAPSQVAADDTRARNRTYSALGIASFAVSCLAVVIFWSGLYYANHYVEGRAAPIVAGGLAVLATLGLDLFAIVIGIADLLQTGRKRLFAVLGIIFATALMLFILSAPLR